MNHPLALFQFCPRCGDSSFEPHNEKAKRCHGCQFIYYLNPSAAVVAVIENSQGEILVARRAHEPARGTLDLPGGFADLQETIEETVRREVLEETNLTIRQLTFLFSLPNNYHYCSFDVPTMDLFFQCEVASFDRIRANDDVSELLFIPKAALNPDDFGLTSIKAGIKKLQQKILG